MEAILKRLQQMLNAQGNTVTLNSKTVHQQVDAMAHQGLRVLAFAKKFVSDEQTINVTCLQHADIENDLIFLGLQGMIDPPRMEAIKAVQACQSAGIQVKMIIGDHAVTAQAIAKRMGFNKNGEIMAFTGQQLAQMDNQQLTTAVADGVVFARVAPEHKTAAGGSTKVSRRNCGDDR